jgi:hypothetical protein
MLADELDYVVGVDPHRHSHALAMVHVFTGAVVPPGCPPSTQRLLRTVAPEVAGSSPVAPVLPDHSPQTGSRAETPRGASPPLACRRMP